MLEVKRVFYDCQQWRRWPLWWLERGLCNRGARAARMYAQTAAGEAVPAGQCGGVMSSEWLRHETLTFEATAGSNTRKRKW
jgi:hypothetical protein